MTDNTKIISISDDPDRAVEIASQIFFDGGVFVYPTDTIYGFGADPFSGAADKISAMKGREESKKFILLVPNINVLNTLTELPDKRYLQFLSSLWPNPVSVILNLNSTSQKKLESDTAAFRIPNHLFCLKLLKRINSPLVSTSVNRSGEPPLINADDIISEFGSDVDAVFYEQTGNDSAASTLINLTGTEPVVIREGKVKFSEIMLRFNAIFIS